MTAPEPLVSAEVDLRDFGYMPLDVVRLRDSDLAAGPSGEVFRAAVLSWCVAWHQQPAASLPDDDAIIARLLGYGRNVKAWVKLRAAGALRGYVKCVDGRLYHPVVAEKANEAWEKKCAQRNRTEAARRVREQQRQSQRQSQNDESSVTDDVTESKGREGKGIEGKLKSKEKTYSAALDPPARINGHDHGEQVAPRKKPRGTVSFSLPEWLLPHSDVWNAWLEARAKAKHPATEWAKLLAVAKLERMKEEGHNVRRLLADAAFHNWQSFYPPRD